MPSLTSALFQLRSEKYSFCVNLRYLKLTEEPSDSEDGRVVISAVEDGVQGREGREAKGVVQVQEGTGRDLCREIPGRSLDPVDVESQIHKGGDYGLGIEAHSDAGLVGGTFLAHYVEGELVAVAQELVAHEVEGARGKDGGNRFLEVLLVHLVPGLDVELVQKVLRLVAGDALEGDGRKHDGDLPDVYSGRALELGDVGTELFLKSGELVGLGLCGLVSALDYGIDALRVETHHVVLVKVRLDSDVWDIDILLEGLPAEDVHHLPCQVGEVVDVLVCHVLVGEFDAYNYVGSHLLGDVRGEIVADATVHQDLVPGAYGGEDAGYGHRRAQGGVELAFMPQQGLARNHLGRDAEIRYGQGGEVDVVLVAYGEPAEDIADVVPEDIP